ncbi:MAG: methyltransferase domain-containing protein [Myxococcales bacterium]|nr:methyltransferase domain-containing protein [Myxococcales bacterium]
MTTALASSPVDRTLNRLIPALLLATGATGLVYEVALSRMLSLYLGSSGASQAITLATFLGGMALGAALAGRAQRGVLSRLGRPLVAYAILEAFIGGWALLLPTLTDATMGTLQVWLTGRDAGGAVALTVKLAACAVVVLPLTAAMGATLPVLSASIDRLQPERGVQLVSRYYWLNAAGAATGAALAGFVLIEAWGLGESLAAGALVNFAVAAIGGSIASRHPAPPRVDSPASSEHGYDGAPIAKLVAAAFLTGLVALLCEVLWTRTAALWLGASVHAFALMLTVTIAGIALGSALAARAIGKGARPEVVLVATQAGAGLCAVALAARLDAAAMDLLLARLKLVHDPDNYGLWLVVSSTLVALHLLPAGLCLGAAFPALLAAARRQGARIDRATAHLLSANTLGNLLGALAGGFVVMPTLGLDGAYLAAGAASFGVAALVAPKPWTRMGTAPIALLAALAVLIALQFPHRDQALTKGLFRLHAPPGRIDPGARLWATVAGEVVLRRDGKDVTVTVERFAGNHLIYATNGKPEGGSGDVPTQLLLGVDGYLAVPHAKDVLVIGLGTGQSAAAVAAKADVQVHVVELSAPVLDAAALFKDLNDDVLHNPRVRVTIADAREILRSLPPASLDLVVSEPSNPWVAGVADLFTVEAFERVASRLRPKGALVQWIQRYEMSDPTFRSILCSLHSVMPHVALFRTMPGDLIVIASKTPLDSPLAAAQATFAAPDLAGYLSRRKGDYVPQDFAQLLVNQLCGSATVAQFCRGFGQPFSEKRPQLEFSAPRDLFAHADATATQRLLDTRTTKHGDTWLAQWLLDHPLDAAGKRALQQYLERSTHSGDAALQLALAQNLPAPVSATVAALPAVPLADAKEAAPWCAWLLAGVPQLIEAQITIVGPVLPDAKAQAWIDRCTLPDIANAHRGAGFALPGRAFVPAR